MSDEFLEMKKLVMSELIGQLDAPDKKSLEKEFNLTDEQLNALISNLLDKWLNNADFVVMLATVLGISLPRKSKENRARYIG